ncbi:MAG TPA: alpha/beta fold hydrolase [Patescibacteria group bacterium]|nr:alpha/beta fold hydrolase [Patescibacteria group bacterium]
MKVILFVLLAILICLLVLLNNQIKSGMGEENSESIFQRNQQTPPSPSPFLFQELTIPYLREKTYESRLGDLEKYSENSNYISYLTSYSSDGLNINGLLTEPKGEKPAAGWPAVIFIHGYIPPNQYKTTERYVAYVDYLARNGFVVFKIDLRGNGDSEGEPGGAYYSSDYIIDTLNAYSALQNSGFKSESPQAPLIDPKRIGLWGHSMAGNVVLRSLAANPDIPAAVIWAGAGYTYTDLSQYRLRDLSYQPQPSDTQRSRKRSQLRALYGDPDPANWFWKLVIPVNYLGDFKGAIQLDHAVDDEVVDIRYSRGLNEILNKTSIPHQLNEFPSGGHNITDPSFAPAMQKTVEFYKKYLGE